MLFRLAIRLVLEFFPRSTMGRFIVLPAACVHEDHQSHSKRKGNGHAGNQSTDSMTAETFKTAEEVSSAQNQNGQYDNIDDYSVENGTIHATGRRTSDNHKETGSVPLTSAAELPIAGLP